MNGGSLIISKSDASEINKLIDAALEDEDDDGNSEMNKIYNILQRTQR